jgi:squalene-hopene/tetraprenyl-beta-curcumene cyclase
MCNDKSRNSRMPTRWRKTFRLAACLPLAFTLACSNPEITVPKSWNQKAAASYLDTRESSWMAWPGAARDHETFCVSCHTSVPYALARPSLRAVLGESTPSANELKLLNSVTKRVRLWKEVDPYYSGEGYDAPKASESRGTESVVNAFILASHDSGGEKISEDAQAAFDNMWALQLTTGKDQGAWSWLQFDLEPWEANDSIYYGATLAALAVGTAPRIYRSAPEIQCNLEMLRNYLDKEYPKQSTLNRVSLLLASARWPELLPRERREAIIQEALAEQRSDGGWNFASLEWSAWNPLGLLHRWIRDDGTPMVRDSDSYSTGLVTFALQEAGMPRTNSSVLRGLAWLLRNQDKTEGYWLSSSLNKRRDPSSNTGRFMSDAATAYAVLALTEGGVVATENASNRFNLTSRRCERCRNTR